jgi:hypothetical protein
LQPILTKIVKGPIRLPIFVVFLDSNISKTPLFGLARGLPIGKGGTKQ